MSVLFNGPLDRLPLDSARMVTREGQFHLISRGERDEKLQRITDFVTAAQQDESGAAIRLPGQNYAKTIEHSMTLGIEVDSSVWQRLTSL